MKQQSIFITIAIAILVGAGAFYGGVQYQKNQQPKLVMGAPEEGKMMIRQGGSAGQGAGQMQGMKPVNGEITGVDDTSITIQTPDGSSKIIIFSDETRINKASEGAKSDLQEGEQIAAFGTEGSDGSVTAQTISIGGMIRQQR
ncbi:MAG: hypothetical protein AAB553_00525 [Patescibacteria group bacterium]